MARIIVEAKAMYGANKRSLSTGTQMPPTNFITVTGATLDFAPIPTSSVMFKQTLYLPVDVGVKVHEVESVPTAVPFRHH
jgi:hypothetical protein